MPATVTDFISFEVRHLIETVCRLSFRAALWHGSLVAVFGMIAVVDPALEIAGTMKPWTGANENAARKPLRAVVAVGSTTIGCTIVIAIRTFGGYTDFDSHLSLCSGCASRDADCSNSS